MSSDEIKELSSFRCFEGEQKVISHYSQILDREKKVQLYLPPKCARNGQRCPVVYCLPGQTDDETLFMMRMGHQKYASKYPLIFVIPQPWPELPVTSDDDATYLAEFGLYVDAETKEFVARRFFMHSYLVNELVPLIDQHFLTIPGARGVMGHSLGGHGALLLGLKHPSIFQSISAMAPVCDPTGADDYVHDAFKLVLGEDRETLKKWDPTQIVITYEGPSRDILISQGGEDKFVTDQNLLRPTAFLEALYKKNLSATFELHPGYKHTDGFIQTFIKDHIKHHHRQLKQFVENREY